MSELGVWTDFLKGSELAFTTLYKKYAPLLFRYGLKLNQDRDLIKDCIQSLYLNLWNSRHKLSQPGSVKNYLCKAFRLEIFKRLGEQEKMKALRYSFETEETISYESEIIQLTIESHREDKIKKAVEQLPDRQREIIFLRYYGNLSYAEIAHTMGIETESVYKLTYKALHKLQHLLSPSVVK